MRRCAAALLCVCLVPVAAAAGEWELGVHAGQSIPTYEQTFTYSPGRFHLPEPLPGITYTEDGVFSLSAQGSVAVGGSLAFFPTRYLGIEARLDTVGVRVDSTGVRYTVSLRSSYPPIPSFTASLDLPPAEGEVDRLTPVSLGLKLRTPGTFRVFVSAGVSYLPTVAATVSQSLAVQLVRYSPPIEAGRVDIRAEALPGEGQSHWGATAGAGIEIGLGKSASLVAEGRAFRYPEHTLEWSIVSPPLPFFQEIRDAAIKELDPVAFKPTFYQVTAGLAFRF